MHSEPEVEHVTLFEVGPRDGLQSITSVVSTADKIALINALSKTGLKKIEVTSFVNPRRIPQLFDAREVMSGIKREPGIDYAVLTPNLKGLEGATEAQASEVAIFTSASEGFCKANLNCSIEESFLRFGPLIEKARLAGIPVRGYVSNVIECPYDGPTLPEKVAEISTRLLEIGCYEVSLGDTIGSGNEATVFKLMQCLINEISPSHLAGHFHDTYGRAIENIGVCLEFGVRVFDASIGGIGGCPFAPGSSGNVSSEEVLRFLEKNGFSTGVDLDAMETVQEFCLAILAKSSEITSGR